MKPLVFVSSVIKEFSTERGIAKSVIESYPYLEAWVFENEAASGGPLEDSYLDKVRACSIFVLILGQKLTAPVQTEYAEAKAHGKRMLILLKRCESIPDAIDRMLAGADAKYAAFEDSVDFESCLRRALDNEIGRALAEPLESRTNKRKETLLRELLTIGKPVCVTPVFPQSHNNMLYSLREVGPDEIVVLKNSSFEAIALPFDKVQVHPAIGGSPAALALDGRLQLISSVRRWRFFPEHALDGHGISKPGTPGGVDVELFRSKLERQGIVSQWNHAAEAMSGEWCVVYDDDGRYFKCEGRMHRGSVEILVGR